MSERVTEQNQKAATPARTVPPVVREVIRSPGQQLDRNTRNDVETRFGHDFSRVRVHTDAKAAQSARTVDAQAYTVGSDVVFAANRYSPDTPAGRRLLTHELAHVVQQEGDRPATPETLKLGSVSDRAEETADEATRVHAAEVGSEESAALRVRQQLRSSRSASSMVRRALTTWAGDWDTDRYKVAKTGKVSDGVDIKLRFKPGPLVDATTIGIVQTVNSKDLGKVLAINPTVAARSIPAGKTGEGVHIDQAPHNRNPLYAVEGAPAKDKYLTDTPANKTWGQHGCHYKDKAGKLHKRDAILEDTPQLPGRGANASQIFETTALAVTGGQRGTYYGSVRWGWMTDGAGTLTKLGLTKVSDDVPSGTFARAANLWGTTKTSKGETTLQLTTAIGRYTNAPDVLLVTDPTDPVKTTIDKLAKNARVEVTDKGPGRAFNKVAPKLRWWKVTAVDGVYAGKVGWVQAVLLSDKKT